MKVRTVFVTGTVWRSSLTHFLRVVQSFLPKQGFSTLGSEGFSTPSGGGVVGNVYRTDETGSL